jgi:hypothetical protein
MKLFLARRRSTVRLISSHGLGHFGSHELQSAEPLFFGHGEFLEGTLVNQLTKLLFVEKTPANMGVPFLKGQEV